jgi:hypothetical protein
MVKNIHPALLACAIIFFAACNKKTPSHQVIIANNSATALKDKAVKINRSDLKDVPEGISFPLITTRSGDTIAAQLDDTNADNAWDELFFVTDIAPNATDTFTLAWTDSPIKFEKRTNIRFGVRQTKEDIVKPALSDTFYADQLPGVIGYQHYQTDGPTWENDKVAFRLYLDGRNSVDVFGKTVSYMTPDSVGIGRDGTTENNYSVMKDWGTDILGVGNSVGIGGISLLIHDSLARLGITEKDSVNNVDSTMFDIVTRGPVRSVMKFTYKNWKPLDRDYFVQATASITPGTYAFKNSVKFDHLKGDETMLVGLVNSNTDHKLTEIVVNDQWVVLLTHDKQSYNKEWYMGMALILPKNVYQGYMEAPKTGSLSTTFLAKLKIENNKPVDYYAVAAWELSDKQFQDSAYFTKYVTNLTEQLTAEIKVTIN